MTKRKPAIQEEHIINELRKPQLRNLYPDIRQLKDSLDQTLWVLWILKEQFPVLGYIPADTISYILNESCGIRQSPESIERVLSKAGNKIDLMKDGAETSYKIMQDGIEYVQKITNKEKTQVYHIGGKTPYSDFKILEDMIKSSNSNLKIVDPYYGRQTLDKLALIQFGKPIKLLTAHLGNRERPADFSSYWQYFKMQYNHIEINIYNTPQDLHDRYILTNNSIIFLGHGIKDFGNKESFIIKFEKNGGKNVLADLNKQFDERWRNSTPVN